MKRQFKKRTKRRNKKLITAIFLVICICIYLWLAINVCIEAETETIDVGSVDTYNGVKATLFGLDVSWLGKENGDVDTSKVGEYSIEYTSFFLLRKYQKVVRVVDRQAPEIILNGDTNITLKDINEFVEPGFRVTDNYDGNIDVNIQVIQVQDNQYEVEYTVADSSNNESTVKREIYIRAGTVYLTFDDGPSLDITPQILDILEERNVKATFFVIGYDEDKEDLIEREYTDGHTIGLHGFSHDYAAIYTDLDTLMENFYAVENMVKESTGGYTSKLIRFPGGASNTVSRQYCNGIMTEAVKRAVEEGYTYFDWNVDSCDAGGAKTAEEVYQNVISGILPGRDNVVLMHDFSGNNKTLDALEKIIDYCVENNYDLRAITSETIPVQHPVAN